MTLFLICSDLLNCLKSVETMVITTEKDQNSLKVIFAKHFLRKANIFCCFDLCSVCPPQIFQVQAKISKVRHVFLDFHSVFYDYDIIYKAVKPQHLKKLQIIQNIKNLMFFTFMFSDLILRKQIKVSSIPFCCCGK